MSVEFIVSCFELKVVTCQSCLIGNRYPVVEHVIFGVFIQISLYNVYLESVILLQCAFFDQFVTLSLHGTLQLDIMQNRIFLYHQHFYDNRPCWPPQINLEAIA